MKVEFDIAFAIIAGTTVMLTLSISFILLFVFSYKRIQKLQMKNLALMDEINQLQDSAKRTKLN